MLQIKTHRQISRHIRLTLVVIAATAAGLLLALTPTPALAATTEACPDQAVREQQKSTYLPDCRAYELVSPAQTDGNEVEGVTAAQEGVDTFQASTEGAAIAYTANGAFPGALSSGVSANYLSDSGALGSPWQTLALDPDNSQVGGLQPKASSRTAGRFAYFSPNLTCGVEETRLPLTALPAGESAEEYTNNIYVWNAADSSYALVTNVKPDDGSNSEYRVDGASDDCSHVIFESEEFPSLAPEKALFEWDQGTLRVASLLPDGTQPVDGISTNYNTGRSDLNQISSDGSRVFFTAEADEGPDEEYEEVFMRLDGTSTVEVSASETSIADRGAKFQIASESGEHVLFTANYGLTETSSTGAPSCEQDTGAGCDLYDYDTATGALTDISADTNGSDSMGADVRGVLGIAEEGEVVYFSASGQLVPDKGNTEEYNEEHHEANVYAYSDGQLSYVASIGEIEAEEEVDTIEGDGVGSRYTVSRVSSDGEFLLFATAKQIVQSDGSIYDNTDAATGKPDFEDYEYSLAAGSVTCVSCDPSGAAPQLRAGATPFSAEFGQYVEQTDGPMERNLANNGEVYFQTTNPVLPQATNNTVNVYEFQPPGIGSCPAGQEAGCVSILDSGTSANATDFEGASANGEDVYLTTYSELAPEDENELRDMYDVREDGGFLATPPPAECEREGTGPNACQGELSTLSAILTPASATGLGGGNLQAPPSTQMQTTTTTTAATLTIVKHSVKGDTATILASVSGAGTVVASGSGVSTATKTPVEAKTVTLKLKLTKADAAEVAKHPGRALKVKVALLFTPASGTAVSKTVTVSFKAKRAKKATKKAKSKGRAKK